MFAFISFVNFKYQGTRIKYLYHQTLRKYYSHEKYYKLYFRYEHFSADGRLGNGVTRQSVKLVPFFKTLISRKWSWNISAQCFLLEQKHI